MEILDSAIQYWMTHQVVIIEALFAVILATVALWLFSNLKRESRENPDLKDLEDTMKKVLQATGMGVEKKPKDLVGLIKEGDLKALDDEGAKKGGDKAAAKPAPSPNSGAPSAPAAAPAQAPDPVQKEEVAKLSGELQTKTKLMSELQQSLLETQEELKKVKAAGADAAPSADTEALKQKADELESKLAEYAIIEDDIANLNLYKEENVRLKNELEKLKGTPAEAQEPAQKTEEPPKPEAKAETKIESKLQAKTEPKPESKPEAKTEPKPEPKSEPKPEAKSESKPAPKPEGQLEDKLVEEMQKSLPVKAKPEVPMAVAQASEAVLDKDTDPEKLLAEFDQLVTNPPKEAKDDGKDPGDKLVEEFENFIKGEGGKQP